jgi:hypothetical protein
MNAIRVKAKISPARVDNSRSGASLEPGNPRKKTPRNTENTGSMSENVSRLMKLALDIAKTATERSGITANRPIRTAKSGNMKPVMAFDKIAPKKRNRSQVLMVKRENARQRLR